MPENVKPKLKKAQHIVEFTLIAPFIIFFIGVVFEIALIVHTNYRFNASLYEAVSLLALNNKINVEKEDTIENIKEYTRILLEHRFAPYRNSLNAELVQAGDVDFIIGEYRYTSTFTLFNYMTSYEPDSYNFLTIIPVNSAVLRKNSFDLSDEILEKLTDIYYNGYKNETSPEGEGTEEGTENGTEENPPEPEIDTGVGETEADINMPEADVQAEEAVKETFDIQMPEVSLQ